jgi:hypothetical protein
LVLPFPPLTELREIMTRMLQLIPPTYMELFWKEFETSEPSPCVPTARRAHCWQGHFQQKAVSDAERKSSQEGSTLWGQACGPRPGGSETLEVSILLGFETLGGMGDYPKSLGPFCP